MNHSIKKLIAIVLSVFFIASLAACSDGPAEDTGEEIDEIVTDAKNAVEDACEEVKEGVEAEDEDC